MTNNSYVHEILELAERVDKLQKKFELLKSEPMVDIIFNAIVKVGKKENVSDKTLLIKRYLRRCYNIDMNSKAVKTRIKNLTKQL
jgi:hypothetical protein